MQVCIDGSSFQLDLSLLNIRWKFECGNAWQLLGGDEFGQSQVAYSKFSLDDPLPFNHPIDMHFAEIGIQVRDKFAMKKYCS